MTGPTLSYVLVSFLAVLNLVDSRTVSHSRGTQASARTGEFGQHVVDIGYAKYLGNYSAPYSLAFLGLPYAEPPVGNLRFRRPEPLDTEVLSRAGGVIDAQSYPNFCVQGSTGQGDAGGAGTEDCLKVNVYTPVNATSESKLPVLFYIHGGGYEYGNPANWPFEHWINQSPNVVIVSVYYRLDSFGFLSHPQFSTDPLLGDHNVGFQDQQLALKWVQENIAAFGGDPGKVTINGQSAGGGSVEMHMIANGETEGTFRGAIGQSVFRVVMPTPEQQEPLFEFYASQAGCGGLSSVSVTIGCLRNASISALARAQDAGVNFNVSLYNRWLPVVDGKIIPDYPTKLLVEGKFTKIPVIVGSTSNETLIGGTNLTEALQSIYPSLTASDLEEFNDVYIPALFSSEEEWFRTATGEVYVRCGREIISNATVKARGKSWTYRYNQPNPTENEPGITEHAAENWMMFRGTNTGTNGTTVFTPFTPIEEAFSEELIAYWLSFVRALDPNVHKLSRSPIWPTFTVDASRKRVVLQEELGVSTTSSGIFVENEPVGDEERCAFVASKVERTQN